jgi:hypothetical protein
MEGTLSVWKAAKRLLRAANWRGNQEQKEKGRWENTENREANSLGHAKRIPPFV